MPFPWKVAKDGEESDNPFFWRVQKDGKTSYLLGTRHSAVSLEELKCSAGIQSQLEKSDLILAETKRVLPHLSYIILKIVTGKADDLTQEYAEERKIVEGLSYIYSQDDSDFKKLSVESQSFLRERGVIDRLSLTGFGFVVDILCNKEAFGEEQLKKSLDGEVKQIAQLHGIPIGALDPREYRSSELKRIHTADYVDEQIRFFSSCPDVVIQIFKEYKSGRGVERQPVVEITEATERIEEVNKETGEVSEEIGEVKTTEVTEPADEPIYVMSEREEDILFKNRHEYWLPVFLSSHNKYDRVFMAVGNLHFTHVNPTYNFLYMLKKEGFSVERLSCE